ncbi:MAG: iron ABC transporter permease [Planctomycetes bacterium]|nr:iron ABC transporter permease [Planctomycetota bacterium]
MTTASQSPAIKPPVAPKRRPLPLLRSRRVGMAWREFLALSIIAVMAAFLLVPIGMAIKAGFTHEGQLSSYWFGRVISNDVMVRNMANSTMLAAATTVACLVVAIPLAMVAGRCRFAGKGVLGVLVLLPMVLPPFVGALSMRRLLSRFGVLNQLLEYIGVLDFSQSLPPDWLGGGFTGVVFLQTLHLFPILYLNASAALANVDPSYAQAARNLGAGPWTTFRKITLPLLRPGLFAGGAIVFIWAFTDVGTPLILGYEALMPVSIFKDLARGDTGPSAYSLVFIMLSGSVTLYVIGKFIFGRSVLPDSAKASTSADLRRLGPLGTVGAWAMFILVILLAVLPHVGVLLTALAEHWVGTILPSGFTLKHMLFVVRHPATYNSMLNSLKYASLATVFDLVFGGLAAWLIVRARVRCRQVLDGVVMLPLAVPGMILAAGYVAMTARNWTGGWLGEQLVAIGPGRNPFWLLVIAYAVRRIPFMVRGVSAGLQQVPVSLEEAARNLGSSQVSAIRRITLPLISANILAAAVLTFTFAMLEVSDSLILAQTQDHYPITKQIYDLAASTGSPQTGYQAAALGVYGMVMLAATMAIAGALLGRRLGAIFRA